MTALRPQFCLSVPAPVTRAGDSLTAVLQVSPHTPITDIRLEYIDGEPGHPVRLKLLPNVVPSAMPVATVVPAAATGDCLPTPRHPSPPPRPSTSATTDDYCSLKDLAVQRGLPYRQLAEAVTRDLMSQSGAFALARRKGRGLLVTLAMLDSYMNNNGGRVQEAPTTSEGTEAEMDAPSAADEDVSRPEHEQDD